MVTRSGTNSVQRTAKNDFGCLRNHYGFCDCGGILLAEQQHAPQERSFAFSNFDSDSNSFAYSDSNSTFHPPSNSLLPSINDESITNSDSDAYAFSFRFELLFLRRRYAELGAKSP